MVHEELLGGEVEVVCDDMRNTFQRTMACQGRTGKTYACRRSGSVIPNLFPHATTSLSATMSN